MKTNSTDSSLTREELEEFLADAEDPVRRANFRYVPDIDLPDDPGERLLLALELSDLLIASLPANDPSFRRVVPMTHGIL